MNIHMKFSVMLASMLLILLVVLVAIGTWVINTIIYELNTNLLTLKLATRIEKIKLTIKLLEDSGVTGIAEYVQQAQAEILQQLQENVAAQTEHYYVIAMKDQTVLFPSTIGQGMENDAEVLRVMSEKKSGTLNYTCEGVAYFIVYRYVDTWDWLIGAALPRTTMFQQRQVYLLTVGWLSLIVFVGLFVLAYIMGRKLIVNPVTALANVAKAIAAGNLDTPLDVSGKDEIGKLARSFAQMRDAIREKMNVLAKKNEELMLEIVERKQAQEALRESESRLQGILDNTSAVIYIKDIEGRFILINRQYEKLFHVTQEKIQGKMSYDVFPKETADTFRANEQKVLEAGVPLQFEEVALRDDGIHTYIAIKFPVYNAAGNPYGVCGISTDITDRKQAEEQIKNQNLLLEQAVQEKQREMEILFDRLLRQEKLATIGQIAGSIAHELRNPLGAIKNSIFFLRRFSQRPNIAASDPKVQKHLKLINTELDTSERVIAYLLQMTRMQPPQREQTDLHPLLDDAVRRCSLPGQIHLKMELSPDPLLVWADPVQLRQVIVNLLTNAIQAIEQDGCITISAKMLTEASTYTITIEDTGPGIEPEALNSIFEPLYTTKATGTGLGLSICKQIIENHQGQINVQSSVGNGTTVTMILPA
jgi:PAS domain S-box-containing protein